MMDKEGYWTAGYHLVVVMGYNTKLVRKEETPKILRRSLESAVEKQVGVGHPGR